MLKEMGMDHTLWGEAIQTNVYILNCCPTKVMQHSTPYEAWLVWKPSLLHLQTFGSTYYVHVPKENRKKLDEKSIKCIFLGYSDEFKAY